MIYLGGDLGICNLFVVQSPAAEALQAGTQISSQLTKK
jgi:hypothetical protein